MADKVHIVPHFHWDREWYFTAEESKILLVNDMEEVLTMLETREDYPCFVLDGQTSVLEDYFSVSPENRERVRALVQRGKLIIGPWYTQTDEMVVGGESIVRNLLYGMKDCREFGSPMMIGYLPDSVGQSARMPQILRGFNIENSMFWRGTSERMGTDRTEFFWEDDDGSRVAVQLLPLGYAIGKYLPVEKEALRKRMEKYMPVLERGTATGHLLVPNGHDQMPLQRDIFQVMETMRELYPDKEFFLSRYEDVFAAIGRQGNLDTLRGEFLDGRYMRVHRSIFSSRADLKAANTRIENKITNLLEPLASIAYKLGFPYHHGLVEAIWKELMKNHAHDSIGCCCSDKVHRAIADRYFLAEERADRLIEFYMRKIVDAMDCSRALDKLTVFNLLPYEREGMIRGKIVTKMKRFVLERPDGSRLEYEIADRRIVDAGLIDRQIVHYGDYEPFVEYTLEFCDRIPAMGFTTYLVREAEALARESPAASIAAGTGESPAASVADGTGESFAASMAAGMEENLAVGPAAGMGENPAVEPADLGGNCRPASPAANTLENEYLSVSVEPNGSLTVLDKQKGQYYRDVLLLEDGSDDGDGYDYSPAADDWVLTSKEETADVRCQHGTYSHKARVRVSMAVPAGLESRSKRRRDGRVDVEFELELKAGSPVLEVRVTVDNQADSHRLRLLVPGQEHEGFSVSDNQFGMIRRPVRDEAMDGWEKEGWSERPDSIYPFLSWVSGCGERGLAVLTNSVREYEMTGPDYGVLAVTLFRSVGVLGKEGLLRRPGRPSGIKMETPDSQLRGSHTYEIALTACRDHLARTAKEYVTPFISYNKMPYNAMKLNPAEAKVPYAYSLLRETEGRVVLGALKKAEDEDKLIARFYNGGGEKVPVRLKDENGDLAVDVVKLNETDVLSRHVTGVQWVGYNQIFTCKF